MRRHSSVLCLLSLSLAAGCRPQAATERPLLPVKITAALPVGADQGSGVRYSASIEPEEQVTLAFKVGGYVKSLLQRPGLNGLMRPVHAGDRVTAGTVLASLQTTDYAPHTAQAAAAQAGAEAAVGQAIAGVAQAEGGAGQANAALQEAEAAQGAAAALVNEAEAARQAAIQQAAAAGIAEQNAKALQQGAEAALQGAEAALVHAQQSFARADTLYAEKSLTRTDYEAATAALKAAQAQESAAKAQALQAKLGVDAAQNRIAQAREATKGAEAKEQQAKEQRLQAAAARGRAVSALYTAKAQTEAAKALLRSARAAETGAAAGLQAAQAPLHDTELTAPFSGVVLSRLVEAGSLAAPGTPAFVLADTSHLKAVFAVPDTQLASLQLGKRVILSSGLPGGAPLFGRITQISPAADTRTRVYRVEVTLTDPGNDIRTGMVVSLSLASGSRKGRVLVPASSLIPSLDHAGGYAVALAVKKNAVTLARFHDVTLGTVYGNEIAVDGIEPGESIITQGAAYVRDGQAIKVVESGEGDANGPAR